MEFDLIKKFRIGNLVRNNQEDLVTVVAISLEDIIFSDSFVCLKQIKPIPIKEELLLKIGFNKDYKKGYIGIDFKVGHMILDFVLTEPQNEPYNYYRFDMLSHIYVKFNYLHELQNFFFAITGTELNCEALS
jgi:hypothetical protein